MSHAFSFGPFRLCPATRVLWKSGTVVPLGGRAFDLLVAMVEHNGKVLTRRELMATAWPRLVVDDSNVRVQVGTLRRALGCGREGARYIANVAGRGYCFVSGVERSESTAPMTCEPGAARDAVPVEEPVRPPRSLPKFPPPLEGAIGREECVAELTQLVTARRLTTVVGAAGIGKTTLAILVAHALDVFDESIFFVDLSAMGPDDIIAEALASAVGYMPSGGDFLPGLMEVLSASRTLVVLDNCEHVIAAAAALCQRFIKETRNVFFLNTSREALRIREELVYLLRPLATPPHTGSLAAKQALAWPAVQLFMERAKEGGARDALSDDDAPTVVSLCRRLDGNPHAIELVGSRVGTYGIQGVADLFERQFALNWHGRRDAIPRHQSVEALIDWSHNLLPERERQVFYRLSVFHGQFSFEAAAAVTSDDQIDASQVVEVIGGLVDKSLVAVSLENCETHIRLLDTTRAYAASRLAKMRDGHDFARRHAKYFEGQLRDHVQSRGSAPISVESARLNVLGLGNVRAAIDWAFASRHDPAMAAEMCGMAAPLFLELGLIRECKRICERAIKELPDRFRSTQLELDLLDSMAITYYSGGDYEGAMRNVVERGLEISLHLGNHESMFHFLAGLHLAMMANGEFRGSLTVCEQYASAAVARGGLTEKIIVGWMEGSSKHYTGDPTAADASYSRSLQTGLGHEMRPLHYFEMKERIIADIGRARVKWALGTPIQAMQIAIKAIDDWRSHPDSLYMCVTLCFSVLLANGLYDRAEELIEELENVAIDYKAAVRRQVIDVLKGHLFLLQGHYAAAIDHLQKCLEMLPPPKMSVVRTDALQSLAEAQLKSGDGVDALAAIDEALDLAEKTHGIFNLSDLLRTKAEVMMSLSNPASSEAKQLLSRAADCAREQKALGWELRVAITVARTRISEGKMSDALDGLEPVFSRFTEGFETSDLKAAAALLRLR